MTRDGWWALDLLGLGFDIIGSGLLILYSTNISITKAYEVVAGPMSIWVFRWGAALFILGSILQFVTRLLRPDQPRGRSTKTSDQSQPTEPS
jgi:hypothetical protein